jgi:hypothetical protein
MAARAQDELAVDLVPPVAGGDELVEAERATVATPPGPTTGILV